MTSYINHVATVPTVYGIETNQPLISRIGEDPVVATVPTVYGIETHQLILGEQLPPYKLQQYLPFTVLKLTIFYVFNKLNEFFCCNSTYRLRY